MPKLLILSLIAAFSVCGSADTSTCSFSLYALVQQFRKPKMSIEEALSTAQRTIPKVKRDLSIDGDDPNWIKLLRDYVRPTWETRNQSLVVTIVGGANVGKSTLLNSIPNLLTEDASHPDSPSSFSNVDPAAGSTARPVMLLNSARRSASPEALTTLFGDLEFDDSGQDSMQPGPPIVKTAQEPPKNVLFVDTPPFDIQDSLRLTTEKALRWSDVIFYVFSPYTYKQKQQIEFIKKAFGQIGVRRLVLIYRTYSDIPERQAIAHMEHVAREIFPNEPNNPFSGLPEPVIATYVMPETREVAKQEQSADLIPVGGATDFRSLVIILSETALRTKSDDITESLATIGEHARSDLELVRKASIEFEMYRQSLNLLLQGTIQQVLGRFPYERLGPDAESAFKRWMPEYIQSLRWATNSVAHPIKTLKEGIQAPTTEHVPWSTRSPQELEVALGDRVDKAIFEFLFSAGTGHVVLNRKQIETPEQQKGIEAVRDMIQDYRAKYSITGDRPSILDSEDHIEIKLPDPQTVQAQLDNLRNRDWVSTRKKLRDTVADSLLSLSTQQRGELEEAVKDYFRNRGFISRTREAVRASTPFLPGLLAFSYIFLSRYNPFLDIPVLIFAGIGTRILVARDQKRLHKSIENVIDKWYREKQGPRISRLMRGQTTDVFEIGQNELRSEDFKKADQAVRTLQKIKRPRIGRHWPW